MNKLYISSKGEIGTLDYWRKEVDNMWKALGPDKDLLRNGFKKPKDAFQRVAKILKLKEL